MATIALYLSLLFALLYTLPSSAQDLPQTPATATYDYVVVGCGIAGLVTSMRLSEDENVSVVCLEAGPFDHYEDSIQIPQFIGRDIGSIYDWNITTTLQTQLDGATRPIPLGRAVGGGSIINGMVWNRGNQDDYNSWQSLGNPGWAWDDLLPYFKKSETFTPIFYEGVAQQPVTFVPDVHGRDGPVSVSYPNYYWPQTDNWFRALNQLGVATVYDPDEGTAAGGYFLASDIQPNNQTRSDARRTYYDPFLGRRNYNVFQNSHVTRILFDNQRQQNDHVSLHATGVEYAADAASPRQTVLARREVILAAGAIHTPQLLQLSGVGPSALLNSLNIPVAQDLPGVGRNLQDHCLVYVNYPCKSNTPFGQSQCLMSNTDQNQSLTTPNECNTNTTFNNEAANEYRTSKTGPWTGMPSSGVAFPSLQQIMPQIPPATSEDLVNLLSAAQGRENWTAYLPSTYDASLRLGYEVQLSTLLPRLSQNITPAWEQAELS
ncbi:hypothetical protein EPUS_08805 [Endocarpon pusillum Z07020]|uniref:Glucose-methanol-choline oxidoreductase N-terminal domain-containing protein n=1 Tax=Endocarpon pusillum (strain Z07020 / HMAS-L-300199) TaxID=1263415 RepID=U1GDJ0_ENDPU|nr:uncharacterized protein EPUS_08805 [Endocarpon pusillum Z07020]ERF75652.1 hypothetical protein EPUS_08805 [Endocarpon pusillum Z07020]